MTDYNAPRLYWTWGNEFATYGPVELPGLIDWIKRERVNANTWIYRDPDQVWTKAAQIPELKMFFKSQVEGPAGKISPGSLRRIKVFAGMDDRQLEDFLQYMEVVSVGKNSLLIKENEHGDAMYIVLAGELRASVVVAGKETRLSILSVGDFLGEISLLDEGPRSANVIANEDSVLVVISAESFQRMVQENPALATPFLYALSRSVVTRLRQISKRYQDSLHCVRLANLYPASKDKDSGEP
jgi:CRP-like cAMP-binding protein